MDLTRIPLVVIGYLGLVLVMSLWTFVVYGFDKRRAVRGGWRVSEQTLHLLALLGGWPGAYLGQRLFRHKISKVPFLMVFWLVVAIHFALAGVVAYAVLADPSPHTLRWPPWRWEGAAEPEPSISIRGVRPPPKGKAR